MIAIEKDEDVRQLACHLYATHPDWVTFYREMLGRNGVIRRVFSTPAELVRFKQTAAYAEILRLMAKLRQQGPVARDEDEPTQVITVRVPKSMHETLRMEADEYGTTMNKLCISKLMQFIDGENVPARTKSP
jgi:predicted HicB family RNase H-like nuclease